MIKKLITATIYSFITFCVVSFFTVMHSLLQSVGNSSMKPATNIGFPFKYYYQFWSKGNDSPNCGWNIDFFIFDALIIWVIVIALFLVVTRKKKSR